MNVRVLLPTAAHRGAAPHRGHPVPRTRICKLVRRKCLAGEHDMRTETVLQTQAVRAGIWDG